MTLINSGKYVTQHFVFNPRLLALVEQDNAIAQLPDEMHSFIQNAPWMDLEPQQVEEIDTSDYRALAEQLRTNLELLQSNNKAKEHKIRELQKKFARRNRAVPRGYRRSVSHGACHDVEMDGADVVVPFAMPVQASWPHDQQQELQQQYADYNHPLTSGQTRGVTMGTRIDFSGSARPRRERGTTTGTRTRHSSSREFSDDRSWWRHFAGV